MNVDRVNDKRDTKYSRNVQFLYIISVEFHQPLNVCIDFEPIYF